MRLNWIATTGLLAVVFLSGCAALPATPIRMGRPQSALSSQNASSISSPAMSGSGHDQFSAVSSNGPVNQESSCSSPIDAEFGRQSAVVDAVGNVIGIPRKILLWDRRADNHRVSGTTVGEVSDYLIMNGLTDVKVRVNQYAPMDEWRRLVHNRRIAPGWKYTVGVLKHLEYSIFPGRIWGGDEYNPFTNSVSLYSDIPSPGLAESAYAKNIHSQSYPGTYATAQLLPIIGLQHESLATDDAMSYVQTFGSSDDLSATRRILYARYGMEVGSNLGGLFHVQGVQLGGVGQAIGAAGGHVAAGMQQDH
ncbi:MAG: hypothetical protein KDA85_11885 [Planctomycetaceae bacterium]|nr:hypothetical protein [Planctomycetaceae bacterium]